MKKKSIPKLKPKSSRSEKKSSEAKIKDSEILDLLQQMN